MYLIMKYEALNDQYECDANRTPVAITGDWRDWIDNNPNFTDMFEVYQWKNKTMTLVRNAWGEGIEQDDFGMAFYFCANKRPYEPPTVIEQWPGRTRHEPIPCNIETDIRNHLESEHDDWDDVVDSIHRNGLYGFLDGENFYIYGEYEGHKYSSY